MDCLVCEHDSSVTVIQSRGYVSVHCDEGCAPLSIVDSLRIRGVLRAPRVGDDLGAKHGNQVRIAYLFEEQFAGKAIHVHGLGWFYWDGKRWVEDRGNKRVTGMLLQTLRRALADSLGDPDLRKAASQCETNGGLTGALSIAATLPGFRVDAEQLDADPYLLNCANGTLDLRELVLRPHDPVDLLTQITEASYDETAKGASWLRFLDEVLPNEAVRDYLQRVVGMALIGRVPEHILPILTGVGANGKSTALDAILYALGTYAITADPNLFIAGKASSLGQVDLLGKRLAVVSETGKGAKLDEEIMKRLTGGDRVKARRLYQDWIEFDPSHIVFMVTNHPPEVSGDDEATWRRLSVIRFDVVVPPERRDSGLSERLRVDAEAILAWAVQGLADYQADGNRLNAPDEVKLATADYREKSDHVGRFIAECCVTTSPVLKVQTSELFEEWQRWATAEGAAALGRSSFQDQVLKRRGITRRRSNGKTWLEGIALKQCTGDDA